MTTATRSLAFSAICALCAPCANAAPTDLTLPQELNQLNNGRGAVSNPGLPATAGQFGAAAVTVGAPPAGTQADGGRASAPGLKLRSSVGRVFTASSPDFLFGDPITPPLFNLAGDPLTPEEAADYWRARPIYPGEEVRFGDDPNHVPRDADNAERYYYSPHSDTAYASQAGRVEVMWRTRVPVDDQNNFGILGETEPNFYTISPSSGRPIRRIYWTGEGFTGPKVTIPDGLVSRVDIAFNNRVPERVELEEEEEDPVPPPDEDDPVPPATGVPPETRTLWFDGAGGVRVLNALNREGRVMVEYLGAAQPGGDGTLLEPLGVEVVDILRNIPPVQVDTYLGEAILPSPNGTDIDAAVDTLEPSPVNIFGVGGVDFTKQELDDGRYYAIRENREPLRVQFYWLEAGLRGILWPTYRNSYRLLWPEDLEDYPAHLARPDRADLSAEAFAALSAQTFAALPLGNTPQLLFQDDFEGEEAELDFQGRLQVALGASDDVNRSLIRMSSGNDFWYLRVYSAPQSEFLNTGGPVNVGQRIEPPEVDASVDDPDKYSVAGYIDTGAGAGGDAYNAGAYIDPFAAGITVAETGAIIPVNALAGDDTLRVWWFTKIEPPADSMSPIYFPSIVGNYTITYPDDATPIVMASNRGSGTLPGAQANGSIYVQNDPALPGYNPNEEHALMLAGTAFALRDDLNVPGKSSEPFVLVDYTAADGRPAMRTFPVLREDDEFKFRYPAIAATQLQAPMPLPIIPKPLLETGQSRNEEILATPNPPANADTLAEFPHYERFTFEDRKGAKWIYRGPHAPHDPATSAELTMRFYYKTMEGFAFPDADGVDSPPVLGTIVPYLRPLDGSDAPVGDPIEGESLDIVFEPVWPDQVPELRFAETLALPKFGLPQVRGQQSLEVIYEGSIAPVGGKRSVVLHDGTREKQYDFNDAGLDRIPSSIATTQSRGKTFFQNLPTHLQERIFVDPNRSDDGALVFTGQFVDEIAGEDYILLNVLSDSELQEVRGLCADDDELKSEWDAAVAAMSTKVERFVEDPAVRGTYIVDPDGDHQTFNASQLAELSRPPAKPRDPSEPDEFYDEGVDSYALTAVGGGSGYVTLITGNGRAFTAEEEPVTMHVIKVGSKLYRGELKPILGGNPLSENVTVQFTGDFAARPGDYQFEWRKAPPVNGLSPAVYQIDYVQVPTDSVSFMNARDATFAPLPQEELDPHSLTLIGEVDIAASVPANSTLSTVYLGLSAGDHDTITVSINGVPVDALPTSSVPDKVALTMGGPNPVDYVLRLDKRLFSLDGTDEFTLAYQSTADPDAESTMDFRLAIAYQEDASTDNYDPLAVEVGKNRHLVAGSGIDTLGDNYFIMRYRPDGAGDDAWSDWTRPALVEGWIKRVLAGINPFNQRIEDFYDNAVDTQVSLIAQAGTRWEGDIALTLDAVAEAGLIEIYETVLGRGIDLSIGGTPEIDYAPANDALLLAAGYLADLYQALGNEAFADAADPTILFDAQAIGGVADTTIATDFESVYRSTATARFAFQGQVPDLLEEELHLLRGRDDFLAPGVEISPAYNRLYWNYTRGIDAGEVIYALNYNIREQDGPDADGKVDAVDAQRMFPQGHGDAYGHYLTALKNYYRLLADEQFTWGTRSEAVNILGQPVSVDYLDERKFATAAASLAQTVVKIQDLEGRKAIKSKPAAGWSHLTGTRENQQTGRIRQWSFDDWSARGGQGAYLHWVTANALLPEDDTVNEGIQKIDRTTVPELAVLASIGEKIQRRIDSADSGLNPLDLSDDSVVFDISPTELAAGKTHFEQVYERAVRALQNANTVFERATDSSRLLRSLENQSGELNAAIYDQEIAFENQLLDIYGMAYPGDIGPGKTYSQGYAGPDLHRYFVIDRPYEVFDRAELFYGGGDEREFTLLLYDNDSDNFFESLDNPGLFSGIAERGENTRQVTYTMNANIGPYQIADQSMGQRPFVGTLQEALNEVRLAEEQLYAGLNSMNFARQVFDAQLERFERDMANRTAIRAQNESLRVADRALNDVVAAVKALKEAFKLQVATNESISEAALSAIPGVNGLSNDLGVGARAIISNAALLVKSTVDLSDIAAAKTEAVAQAVFLGVEEAVHASVLGIEEDTFLRGQTADLKSKYYAARSKLREVDALSVAYTRALENYRNRQIDGLTVLSLRETYRTRAAAVVQGYRTRDVAFRAFRTEALEQYSTLFDTAAKYSFLAAQAYDYETGLLNSDDGRAYLGDIVASRSLGLLDDNGQPTFAASETGDAGLAGLLAKMSGDWEVVRSRLGFNNPDTYGTTFSLREEFFRIPQGPNGDRQWRETLASLVLPNLLADSDVAAHALQIEAGSDSLNPGIVLNFPSRIAAGENFFGRDIAAGDHRFTESNFATKIASAGVVFHGYKGMDPCLVCIHGPVHDTSGHPDALAATPHVYLLPAGADEMRTPPLGDASATRRWQVFDHALPLPFDIGNTSVGDIPRDGVGSDLMTARKHQAFRAVGTEEFFFSPFSADYTNSRLVGRSAANDSWKLVIPGRELLDDPDEGMRRFINSVSDIKLHLRTYSYSGN